MEEREQRREEEMRREVGGCFSQGREGGMVYAGGMLDIMMTVSAGGRVYCIGTK